MTKEEYAERRLTEEKKCTVCGRKKILSAFQTWKQRDRVYVKNMCSGCKSKAYRKKHPENHKRIQKRARAKYRRFNWKRKQILLEHLNQLECQHCGIDDIRVLSFHHRDPSTKKFSLSFATSHCYGIKSMKKEADKCDVLCLNCHAIHHATLCG